MEVKNVRVRTESTVERENDESLLRLDGNNFNEFASADIDDDSWSTSSNDSNKSERPNCIVQSDDTTSDSQSTPLSSDFQKKNVYQSDDSFTFDRGSCDEGQSELSEDDSLDESACIIDSTDAEANNRSYLFLLMEYCSNRTLKDEIYIRKVFNIGC